jgi:hypothetical protein
MATFVMQSLGCEVAALNTVHFSETPSAFLLQLCRPVWSILHLMSFKNFMLAFFFFKRVCNANRFPNTLEHGPYSHGRQVTTLAMGKSKGRSRRLTKFPLFTKACVRIS